MASLKHQKTAVRVKPVMRTVEPSTKKQRGICFDWNCAGTVGDEAFCGNCGLLASRHDPLAQWLVLDADHRAISLVNDLHEPSRRMSVVLERHDDTVAVGYGRTIAEAGINAVKRLLGERETKVTTWHP